MSKVMRRILVALTAIAIAVMIGFSGSKVAAQDDGQLKMTPEQTRGDLFGPARLDPRYSEAVTFLEYPDSRGLDKLRVLAETSRGQELEAIARLTLAGQLRKFYYYDHRNDVPLDEATKAAIRQEYQRVLDGFPETQYWLFAREELWRMDESLSSEQFAQLIDRMVAGFTGITVESVLTGERPRLDPSLRQRYSERFLDELALYYPLGRPPNVRVAEFLRSNFPLSHRTHPIGRFMDAAMIPVVIGAPEVPDPPEPPLYLNISYPRAGQVLSPAEVRLEAEIHGGDVHQNQPSLNSSQVELDSVSIIREAIFDSTITPEGPVLENLRMSWRPSSPLSPGAHTFRVKIDGLVPVEQTVAFTVVQPSALSLSVEVLWKHVKPRKGETARLRVTASNRPCNFTWAIYRVSATRGPLVYSSSYQSSDGVLNLSWSGVDNSGRAVANGSYVIEVTATDANGQSATDQGHVVVNQ